MTESSAEHLEEGGRVVRLQRALAMAGLGSRRECEELILEGRVEVDGNVVTTLGTKVDLESQKVLVDGERLKLSRLQYYAVNKPPGVLSTNADPDGRTRVIDLIKTDYRVYNVGRLDQSSEGLILVTNDGDLANRLTHPKFGIEKTYLVQTVGVPTPEQLSQLERGVYLAEGKAKAKRVKLVKRNKIGAVLEIVLAEGRNREIRRLLARVGHKVTRLQRIAIGPLKLGLMGVGEHRKLTQEEVRALQTWQPDKSVNRELKGKTAGTRDRSSKGARPGGRSSTGSPKSGRAVSGNRNSAKRASAAGGRSTKGKRSTSSDRLSRGSRTEGSRRDSSDRRSTGTGRGSGSNRKSGGGAGVSGKRPARGGRPAGLGHSKGPRSTKGGRPTGFKSRPGQAPPSGRPQNRPKKGGHPEGLIDNED
ncbi:MAG: pseudouridine synthase [Pirellulaceae bacterium]|nr:pseudouridine synthase [Pirellulaceae bacterium]